MQPRSFTAAAYLITFHTYGSWLPGDERGTVRRHQNRYGEPMRGRCDALHARSRELLQSAPVVLDTAERLVVLRAFSEVCQHRGWSMHAAHVRTNHVHVVVTAGAPPERIMGDLKAWATRRLAEAGHRARGARVWVRGGSQRVLWDQAAIDAARFYVLHEQGEPLPGAPSLALGRPL